MAKGAMAKEIIISKILETFDGAFKHDKEIRIPLMENGEEVQIKVALTCAKTNVDRGSDVAIPGATPTSVPATPAATVTKTASVVEPTEEEKKNVEDLLVKLGLK